MAKEADFPADMAHARQSEGIKVIFDQESSASPRSCSSSASSCDSGRLSGSRVQKDREHRRRRDRSSSSSSSGSSSSPRPRSRSHPRCYRPSSRCRCDGHYGRSRRYRAHSRSSSRSPSTYRHSHHRRNRRSPSRSRSPSHRRHTHHNRSRVSQPRADRSRSRSPISRQPNSLSLQDKRELLKAAKENAEKLLGVQELALPESVKPILPEQPEKSREPSPEPAMWVRVNPKKTASQSEEEEEPEEESSPSTSPKRKIISFSINNSVAKPTVAPPTAKVTARVDSYESRKPYGHWVPVKSSRTSRPRKPTKSH